MRLAILASTLACVASAGRTQDLAYFDDPRHMPAEYVVRTAALRSASWDVGARVREIIEGVRLEAGAPGITVAWVTLDGENGSEATGVSNKGAHTPMQADDRMFAGSVGKTFCAAVAMQLVQEGTLDLDAKLSIWLGDRPWFKRLPNAEAITLRQLMNHTSGVPEHVQSLEFTAALRASPQETWTPDELVAFVLDKPALFPAGEGWSYADTNYILVGMVIEKATGRKYEDLVAERLIVPLELTETSCQLQAKIPGLISGYTSATSPFGFPEETAAGETYCINPQFEWTGGGIVSSSPDLARWALAFYGTSKVVDAKTRGVMLDGVPAKLGPGSTYGLGVITWPTPHGVAQGHSGWFPGYVTTIAYYPDLKLAAAVQINTDIGVGLKVMRDVLDQVAGAVSE